MVSAFFHSCFLITQSLTHANRTLDGPAITLKLRRPELATPSSCLHACVLPVPAWRLQTGPCGQAACHTGGARLPRPQSLAVEQGALLRPGTLTSHSVGRTGSQAWLAKAPRCTLAARRGSPWLQVRAQGKREAVCSPKDYGPWAQSPMPRTRLVSSPLSASSPRLWPPVTRFPLGESLSHSFGPTVWVGFQPASLTPCL